MDIKVTFHSDEMGEDVVVDGLLRELREAASEGAAENRVWPKVRESVT